MCQKQKYNWDYLTQEKKKILSEVELDQFVDKLEVGKKRGGVEVCIGCGRALLYSEDYMCQDCLEGKKVSREITKLGEILG